MKNKAVPILILIVLSISFCLMACEYFSPLVKYYGVVLKTDDLGHFKEDIIYQNGSNIYKFKQNGEFEYYSESYEAAGEDHDGDGEIAEGWVKTSGEKGTYSWDVETYIIISIISQEIVNGGWENISNQITYTDFQYFAEHNFCPVWISGISYDFDNINVLGWRNVHITETENAGTVEIVKVIELQEDSGNINYLYENKTIDTDGNVVSVDQTLRQAEYNTYPSGTNVVKAGNFFTLQATVTTTLYSSAPDYVDNYIITWDFISGGQIGFFDDNTFWIEWPSEASLRGIF